MWERVLAHLTAARHNASLLLDSTLVRAQQQAATLTVEDDRRDYGEDRLITIGFLNDVMVVLVWTPRDGAYRIISMRKANERERTLYTPRF